MTLQVPSTSFPVQDEDGGNIENPENPAPAEDWKGMDVSTKIPSNQTFIGFWRRCFSVHTILIHSAY